MMTQQMNSAPFFEGVDALGADTTMSQLEAWFEVILCPARP
jgi:hypothetical protein